MPKAKERAAEVPGVVFIRGLRVEAIIGAFDWEREVDQVVQIDAELHCDIGKAAASDDLADALDYKQVSKRLSQLVREGRFHLLEALADKLVSTILSDFPSVQKIRLEVAKPGAVRGTEMVGVRLERER